MLYANMCEVKYDAVPVVELMSGTGATTLPPCEGAELVMFSGSTPSCDREISPEYEAACTKAWAGKAA